MTDKRSSVKIRLKMFGLEAAVDVTLEPSTDPDTFTVAGDNMVIVPVSIADAWRETEWLLSDRNDAEALLQSISELESGGGKLNVRRELAASSE